jgi:endonuclease VIII
MPRGYAGYTAAVPEGHTIHRLARHHGQALAGQRLAVSSPQGRFAAAEVDGLVLEDTDAWGKHLFYEFEGERFVHVHLGIYGNFTEHAVLPPPSPRPTTRMRLVGDAVAYDLVGPTTCRVVGLKERDTVIARLGPDPLRRDADPDRAFQALARRRSSIGQALMDQSFVAGVGNVYRAEALFVHGIHPLRPATAIDRETWDELWATLVRMLRAGVRAGRIVTVPRAEQREGATRYVYRREHCLRCGTPVQRWELAGRWAYACPRDQPG